jgi:hypothetical protein
VTVHQEYFNASGTKTLATSSADGSPNVCLCGTAFMPDADTIVAASGFFDRTDAYLAETGKAVFMAIRPLTAEYWIDYEATGEQPFPAGVRFYCTLRETATSGPLLDGIRERLRPRVGNRVPDGMHDLLVFDVVEVRELDF